MPSATVAADEDRTAGDPLKGAARDGKVRLRQSQRVRSS